MAVGKKTATGFQRSPSIFLTIYSLLNPLPRLGVGNAKWLKRRFREPLNPATDSCSVVKIHSHSRIDRLSWPQCPGAAGRGWGAPPGVWFLTCRPSCRSLRPLKQVAVSPDCLPEPSLLNGRHKHNFPSLRGVKVHPPPPATTGKLCRHSPPL